MSKVKVKKMRMPIGGSDTDLSEMFNQMLGTGNVNMTIAYPKYDKIKTSCEQYIKIIKMITDSPFMKKFTNFAQQNEELLNYISKSREEMDDIFKIDFTDYEWNFDILSNTQREQFNQHYEKMKKSQLIASMIATCDRLTPYKNHLLEEKPQHKFILDTPGVEWCPFTFSNLNIKAIFCLPEVGENTIRFFMAVIQKIFDLTKKIWTEISSPDIDVNQFVDVIMTNIDFIQKRPELARCKKAFSKIKSSVGLLKDRFNNYYKDFIKTKESTIIFEHFIIDVSKSTDVDPQEIAQFRVIIDYYRKIASQQSQNPQVKMLFEKVEESFKALEKSAPNLAKDEEDFKQEPEDLPAPAQLPPRIDPGQLQREKAAAKTVDQLVAEINAAGKRKKAHN